MGSEMSVPVDLQQNRAYAEQQRMYKHSVIKRMKDKAFARQVPREHLVRGAELMGLPLEEHVTNVIQFMRLQADALGLRGTL